MVEQKTIEDFVNEAKGSLEIAKAEGKPVIYLLDTGALIELYASEGDGMFKNKLYGDRVVTEQVIKELERQRDTKRLNDDKKLLVPYELTNLLYAVTGMNEVHRMEASPNETEAKAIKDAMSKSPLNTDGNSRIGSGDLSLINFARTFSPDLCVIVSTDSDIPMIISGLDEKNIRYLKPADYAKLKNAA